MTVCPAPRDAGQDERVTSELFDGRVVEDQTGDGVVRRWHRTCTTNRKRRIGAGDPFARISGGVS